MKAFGPRVLKSRVRGVSLRPLQLGGQLSQRFISCIQEDKGGSTCPFAQAICQITLIQSNQHCGIFRDGLPWAPTIAFYEIKNMKLLIVREWFNTMIMIVTQLLNDVLKDIKVMLILL